MPLDLTYKEFELLKYLAQHPGRVFTRAQLLQEVWGYDYFGGTRTVDVHVRRLRAKLGPEHEQLIGTVRNVGYRFDPAPTHRRSHRARSRPRTPSTGDGREPRRAPAALARLSWSAGAGNAWSARPAVPRGGPCPADARLARRLAAPRPRAVLAHLPDDERNLLDVLRTEKAGGALLLLGAAVALIWANSPWSRGLRRRW